jgi:anti-sigma B factor antagonist
MNGHRERRRYPSVVDGSETGGMWNPFKPNSPDPAPAVPSAQLVLEQDAVKEQLAQGAAAANAGRAKIAEVQRIGPTAVATLTVTELTQEKGVAMLADLLDELGETGATHFVLDIQNVQFMDSACLGCLVEALNRLSAGGGKIALANTANSVQYLFRMTQLDRVFPICADVMAALSAVERVPGQDQ